MTERITWIDAFLKILKQEAAEPAKPFVLGNVSQFMHEQAAVSPMLRLNKDAIAQCHPNGLTGHDPQPCAERP